MDLTHDFGIGGFAVACTQPNPNTSPNPITLIGSEEFRRLVLSQDPVKMKMLLSFLFLDGHEEDPSP